MKDKCKEKDCNKKRAMGILVSDLCYGHLWVYALATEQQRKGIEQ